MRPHCVVLGHGSAQAPVRRERPPLTTTSPGFTIIHFGSSPHKQTQSSPDRNAKKEHGKGAQPDGSGKNVEEGLNATSGLDATSTVVQSTRSTSELQSPTKGHSSAMSLGRIPSRHSQIHMASAQKQQHAVPRGRSSSASASRVSLVAGGERAPTLEQSVRKFRIVEALRSGNTAAISKAIRDASSEVDRRSSTCSTTAATAGALEDTTVLHLAIQCAEFAVIESVLSAFAGDIDVNARDKDGNVPLHIAASQGRANVVRLLLEQPNINDAVANSQGKLPLDVARSPEIFQQLQLSRTLFVQEKVKHVQELVQNRDYDTLGRVLEEPRVKTILDVNSVELPSDPITLHTGGTLLHEAARKKDTKLIQALLLHGADPFQRDRKGKLPQDVTKDDLTRAMLKKSPAAVAAQRGIQEKAVLGHAASQGGGTAPTGAGDPTAGREPQMKGYLKKWTNYRKGYQLRWFVLENGVLSYYKHQDDAENACRGAISMRIAKLHMSADEKTKFEIIGKSSVKYTLKANHEVEAKRWFWALNNAIQWMKDQAKEEERQKAQKEEILRQAAKDQQAGKSADTPANDPFNEGASATRSSLQLSRIESKRASHSRVGPSHASTTGSVDDEFAEAEGKDENRLFRVRSHGGPTTAGDGDDDSDDEVESSGGGGGPPVAASKDAFTITAQSAKLQLDTLAQVSAALQVEAQRNPGMSLADASAAQALATYDAAIRSLKGLMGDLVRISRDRDAHWQYRLDQEVEIRRMWEESMAKVAKEQDVLEQRMGEAESKRRAAKRALREVMGGGNGPGSRTCSRARAGDMDGNADTDLSRAKSPGLSKHTKMSQLVDLSQDSDSSDMEEFFDAVDAGQVEVEPLPPAETAATLTETNKEADLPGVSDISRSYRGYEKGFRTKLKMDADNRPKISLWGVLKSMIGKDMTKMTLPVSFNEPTSLLNRLAEDMEYADLLDQAAERPDSTERLLYVAAFAASEFASTIGRVAKPFNPLLGETFEYVRPDKGYRFLIEQISHHPPVSATWAESSNWTYYGENSVKSKFYGKSFDIVNLGTWFLKVQPKSGDKADLYTWKKPTTSVLGIITGNPVIDNYGLVEIKNWTTGETCTLDFKPRGWKASSAYNVGGKVVDSDGRPRFSIGGRWNSKIFARYTPGYEAAVEAPAGDEVSNERGNISDTTKAFLIWQAHERPEGIPFSLTPFVLTMNDINDELKKYLAPTDTRYRPDQRAMEEGEYDLAATEKERLEQEQRARRREREEKGEHFTPAWFVRETCDITGEEYWRCTGQYWDRRDRFGQGDEDAFKGLEPIFTPAKSG